MLLAKIPKTQDQRRVHKQVMEERTVDLHRQLLLAQSELKAGKEEAQIQELKHAHLQTQLAGDSPCCAHCLHYLICVCSMGELS